MKYNYDIRLWAAITEIKDEVIRAKKLFPTDFVNQHEAYAVLLEEVDELWDEIKKNQRNYDLAAQRKEAVQAGAMLCRLLVELLTVEPAEKQPKETISATISPNGVQDKGATNKTA